MATYGLDFYGRSKYGGRPHIELVVDPFEAHVLGYRNVRLVWNDPGGDWRGFRLLRNRHGFPVTEDDGVVLVDVPIDSSLSPGTGYLDSGLEGGWYYYGLFLWSNEDQDWVRAGAVDALVPFDFGSTDKMWDTLPEYYKQIRDEGAGYDETRYQINPAIFIDNTDVVPNLLLAKFLQLFGWAFDILRTQADHTLDGYDVNAVHINRVALLAAQFGTEIEESAPGTANRSMIRNLGWLYRQRGTTEGIRELLSLATGWEVDVTLGPNLMLSEDQSDLKNPRAPLWDPTIRYVAGDRVRNNKILFESKGVSYGALQGPPDTKVDNAYWTAVNDPLQDMTTARSDTGDVSTWQIEGPDGFVSGRTFVGAGTPDPEDPGVLFENSLGFRNETTTASADFTVRSIPRHKDSLGSWGTHMAITNGIPVPRANRKYVAGTRYRAGTRVLFEGAVYEALTSTDEDPTTAAWQRLGYDDRVRLALSVFAHGPFNGTAGQGGKLVHPVVTEFDEHGNFIRDTLFNPASYNNIFYDAFNTPGLLTAGRVPAVGIGWYGGSGSWKQARDDFGGHVVPPVAGRSYQVTMDTVADGNVGVTFKANLTRLYGAVFRWSSGTNYWIATQTGVYKVVNGAALANPASGPLTYPAFQPGDRMRVQFDGNTITVYRNGDILGTATDSFNATAKRHGVGVEA